MKNVFTKFLKSEEGFTLIELLVVIVIIGVLAAIALPIFLNQQKAAADAALKSDVRSIARVYTEWQLKHVGEEFPALRIDWRNYVTEDPTSHDNKKIRQLVSISDGTRINARDAANAPANGDSDNRGKTFCIQASNDGSNYSGTIGVAGQRLYFQGDKGFVTSC